MGWLRFCRSSHFGWTWSQPRVRLRFAPWLYVRTHRKWEVVIWALVFSCWVTEAQNDRPITQTHVQPLFPSCCSQPIDQNKPSGLLTHPMISGSWKYALLQGGEGRDCLLNLIQFITATLKASTLIQHILKLSISAVILQFPYKTCEAASSFISGNCLVIPWSEFKAKRGPLFEL